ncbi:RBBP9/YdeN family alpha/beta hydrolase [Pseudomonas sp. BMS12]|uniref:RBBP9/YdeN family alpha/beta hydrolase n=1 Tax=Pseudomonas sp. BMS12 TaxID=1796033 RepID=UPI00083B3FE5|nr:alpha/beta fold hydrolase [Pseudomonas sp. BMS12]
MQTTFLIIPGYGDSGPGHWQSRWQSQDASFVRVRQRDWLNPVCAEWVANLEAAVTEAGAGCVLVAHSLGCNLVAHWAAQTQQRVRAALLVAPPDPQGPAAELNLQGFAPLPEQSLPFSSLVVASCDDPYASLAYTQAVAARWGSRWHNLGVCGHINGDSKLGDWPQGRVLLQSLLG